MCSFLIQNSIIEADSSLYHMSSLFQTVRLSVALTHAEAYLLYPLLGWLSDVYFTRYKVIRLAFIIMRMHIVVMVATGIETAYVLDGSITTDLNKIIIVLTLVLPFLLLGVLSLGLFEANVIQLGMDQLLEASSDQLSSFIHWYYWSSSLGRVSAILVMAALVLLHTSCTVYEADIKSNIHPSFAYPIGIQFALCISIIFLPLVFIGLFLLFRYIKTISISRNPGIIHSS